MANWNTEYTYRTAKGKARIWKIEWFDQDPDNAFGAMDNLTGYSKYGGQITYPEGPTKRFGFETLKDAKAWAVGHLGE